MHRGLGAVLGSDQKFLVNTANPSKTTHLAIESGWFINMAGMSCQKGVVFEKYCDELKKANISSF